MCVVFKAVFCLASLLVGLGLHGCLCIVVEALPAGADSWVVLLVAMCQMMMNFTVDCVRGSKDGVLLLITADAGKSCWWAS